MRILLTGATGFVGSHLLPVLLGAGHELRLLVRSPARLEASAGARLLQGAQLVRGDMTDAGAVDRALHGCDAAVHAAAGVSIGRSGGVYQANVIGARNVLCGAAARGLDPVVHLSSVATLFPPPGPVFRADDPVRSLDTEYGRSKAEAERLARSLQAGGAPLVTIYPAGVYGPDDPGPSQAMKGLRDRIRYGWALTSGGVGLLDVRDLAALVGAACEPGRGPRRFMAGGHFLSWAQEADLCQEITGRKVRRIPAPAALVRAAGHVVDAIRRVVPSFDYPLTHEAALFATRSVPVEDRRTREELGIRYRPVRETLSDSLRWLVKAGQLAPRYAPRLATRALPPTNGS